MNVIIDGIEYVPKTEIPQITDERLKRALESLTEIQYFHECTNKHKAWAWDAINALAPDLAEMSSNSAQAAYDFVRDE